MTDMPPSRNKGPAHYTGLAIQPWEAMESWMTKEQFQGFLLGSAVAYLARFNAEAPEKGGREDVAKAHHYLEKLLSVMADNGGMP